MEGTATGADAATEASRHLSGNEMTHPRRSVIQFAHARRSQVAAAVYASSSSVALALAFLLRFEWSWPADQIVLYWMVLPWILALRVGSAVAFRLTSVRWRFVGISDVSRLTAAVAGSTAVYWLFSWGIPLLPKLPRSVMLIEAVVTQYLVAGIWLTYRYGYERMQRSRGGTSARRRVLMVGAGEAGQMLVREMQRTPSGMVPVGYVDDDEMKRGLRIHGVKVWGPVEELPGLVARRKADEVVIAVPSAEPTRIRRIVELCELTEKPFSILPGIAEVLSGEAHLAQVREVRVDDLLGRKPVAMELPALRADLGGTTVLITGAAGSIGSELARQVALHSPARLVLADQAETPLYFLDLELRGQVPDYEVVPVVADIADQAAVDRLFSTYRPGRVFHAAAYKHVPMMERHPLEAVRNNVVGTWIVADAAGRHGADKFVLVSTDKAVRPANVMGASKRMAELVVLEAQRIHPGTGFGAVRFGNVLGSSGSVIPLFRKLIEEGRPLTITHEDVSRYFMTIPEAVQLILKASLLPALRGHVAMLEMGEPVRILDLAKNLLRLVGEPYRPGENVVFTGLRPGEKLEEELVAPDEHVEATDVEKVYLVLSDERVDGCGWLSADELDRLRDEDVGSLLGLLAERFPSAVSERHVNEGMEAL